MFYENSPNFFRNYNKCSLIHPLIRIIGRTKFQSTEAYLKRRRSVYVSE